MTHEEKWKRIGEIDDRLKAVDVEWKQLADEKNRLLMTQASDETRFLTPRKGEQLRRGPRPKDGRPRMMRTDKGWVPFRVY